MHVVLCVSECVCKGVKGGGGREGEDAICGAFLEYLCENQIQSQEPFVGHLPCPRYSVGHTHFYYLLGPYVTQ